MEKIFGLLNAKTLDIILSDGLLLSGVILIGLGLILFLFAAVKFFLYKKPSDLIMPHQEPALEPESFMNNANEAHSDSAETKEEPFYQELNTAPEPEPAPAPVKIRHIENSARANETMVMAPGVSDLQAQFEIAISQIKQLNKKVYELERQIETFATRTEARLEPHELKEPPMDAGDFTKKLLKVVEHVIILEKEVNKLRGQEPHKEPVEATQASAKPTIMPL